ncbi:hypothetical protein M9H77_03060 [Catharanthus roseus]|uniref:Uncharacterized protein n=1 Tax=Catharanthus roseus TaxID=4058 RepID=A0ACC0CA56_CATRO|nr:hypothetical protein M9H77_03060 [Catharanthus roseus]
MPWVILTGVRIEVGPVQHSKPGLSSQKESTQKPGTKALYFSRRLADRASLNMIIEKSFGEEENDDYQPGRNKFFNSQHSTIAWTLPSEEDRLRDSASDFRPIKKTTQFGIEALSSQPVEDNDEAEASDD